MSATKILWGQVITVFGIVLLTIWTATEWTAWRLGFQPELGRPWFEILHFPFYLPPAFFWWWYAYDAYAPSIFIEGAYIAASGGIIAAAVAIGMSVWRAREAKNAETYGSARWAQRQEIEEAGLLHNAVCSQTKNSVRSTHGSTKCPMSQVIFRVVEDEFLGYVSGRAPLTMRRRGAM